MEPITNATVYIVDDDASVREALAWLLRSRRLPSESFDSAEAFDAMLQKRPPQRQPCCLLLDVRCLLYTSPSPRDKRQSRMPSSA